MRDDNDANCTYEGDNNVLLQQTSNWLINLKGNLDKKPHDFRCLSFLEISSAHFEPRSLKQLLNPTIILNTYKWLVSYLLEMSSKKFTSLVNEGVDSFTARNESQVFHARTLSIAFIEHLVLEQFWEQLCKKQGLPQAVQIVLKKIMMLFGLWSLEKHLGTLYQGKYIQGPEGAILIRQGILKLCADLKPEAVALVDAIAPPDFILNSPLGASDGQVYKHLQMAMSQTPGGYTRPDWWTDVSERLQSKL